MISLILVVALIVTIMSIMSDSDSTGVEVSMTIGVLTSIGAAFLLFFLLGSFPYNVDKKLIMYKEQNAEIETKVKETVKAYMEYEEKTYKNLVENSDLQTLLIKYPQLNSNELIKAEIETYKENSKMIRELKSKQIDKSTMAWWIYFGN